MKTIPLKVFGTAAHQITLADVHGGLRCLQQMKSSECLKIIPKKITIWQDGVLETFDKQSFFSQSISTCQDKTSRGWAAEIDYVAKDAKAAKSIKEFPVVICQPITMHTF